MNEEQDEEVRSLIEELERLQLQIGAVNQRLRNLESRRHTITETVASQNSSNSVGDSSRRSKRKDTKARGRHRTGPKSTVFEIGDKVRVLNPTKKQPIDTGRVTGYTRNGYIRFTLDDGIETCRSSKNLKLVSSVNERK